MNRPLIRCMSPATGGFVLIPWRRLFYFACQNGEGVSMLVVQRKVFPPGPPGTRYERPIPVASKEH